jgi:hypothetical protein
VLPWSATLELPGGEAPYNARMYGGRPTLDLPTLELPWSPEGHIYIISRGRPTLERPAHPGAKRPTLEREKAYPAAKKTPWSAERPLWSGPPWTRA